MTRTRFTGSKAVTRKVFRSLLSTADPAQARPLFIVASSTLNFTASSSSINAAQAARVVLALPVHPYLSERDLDRIIESVKEVAGA